MRIFITIISLVCSLIGLTACAQNQSKNQTTKEMSKKKILVAYFSRADENYSVGRIKVGNTQIVAEMIAAHTGADQFHIETVKPYPAEYDACVALAKKEKETNARPAIKGDVKVEDYDVIFIATPNWWGEAPMALYTFIEKHSWQGKTIIPFATHEGSGMGGMDRRILKACQGATMLQGFAVYGHEAQNEREETQNKVDKWLGGLQL